MTKIATKQSSIDTFIYKNSLQYALDINSRDFDKVLARNDWKNGAKWMYRAIIKSPESFGINQTNKDLQDLLEERSFVTQDMLKAKDYEKIIHKTRIKQINNQIKRLLEL